MDNIRIEKVTQAELEELQTIAVQTFHETFAERNTEEDMKMYLSESFSLEKLTSEFNNAASEFYFARHNKKTIGYLKLNFGSAQTDLTDANAVEIERIYVLQAYHGKKVGQVLYDKALEIARQRKAEYLWLGVWEENPRAIAFYKKNGFVAFDKHIFKLGNDEQTDILMRLKLKID
ncbi:GNAT family N-acetyltransferase [Cesiribacter sp. SM1]|uniref:GNAT family N-acetyltransferase n=1 Tax=Cesiribacter sp. SM1 TaxID=2861196 RepID=UPI001CD1CE36|nr:GNAT family N-acetyltransferase [Cesiribacter sp. SM1]